MNHTNEVTIKPTINEKIQELARFSQEKSSSKLTEQTQRLADFCRLLDEVARQIAGMSDSNLRGDAEYQFSKCVQLPVAGTSEKCDLTWRLPSGCTLNSPKDFAIIAILPTANPLVKAVAQVCEENQDIRRLLVCSGTTERVLSIAAAEGPQDHIIPKRRILRLNETLEAITNPQTPNEARRAASQAVIRHLADVTHGNPHFFREFVGVAGKCLILDPNEHNDWNMIQSSSWLPVTDQMLKPSDLTTHQIEHLRIAFNNESVSSLVDLLTMKQDNPAPTTAALAAKQRAPVSQERLNQIEAAALEAIIEREPFLNRPTVVNNHGFDLAGVSADYGEMFVEVKSLAGSWSRSPVLVSRRQILEAACRRERFWLYVVEFAETPAKRQIFRIRDPWHGLGAGKFSFSANWRSWASKS
jgi:hypothetical protein